MRTNWKNIVIAVLAILLIVVFFFGRDTRCSGTASADKSADVAKVTITTPNPNPNPAINQAPKPAPTPNTDKDCDKQKKIDATSSVSHITIDAVVRIEQKQPPKRPAIVQPIKPAVISPVEKVQSNPQSNPTAIIVSKNVTPIPNTISKDVMTTNEKKLPIDLTFRLGRNDLLWVPDQWIRYEGATYSNQVDNKHESWNWRFPVGGEFDEPTGISGRLTDGRNFVRADQIDKYLEDCSEKIVESWCNYDRGLRECSKQTFGGVEYYVNLK